MRVFSRVEGERGDRWDIERTQVLMCLFLQVNNISTELFEKSLDGENIYEPVSGNHN